MLAQHPVSATLPASDIDRARAFYRDVLALEIVEVIEETGETVFESGEGTLLFVYPSGSAGTNRATAAAWRVDDLVATIAELRGRGVTFLEYDLPDIKTVDAIAVGPDGTKVAWFEDTEGNILALDQLPDDRGLD